VVTSPRTILLVSAEYPPDPGGVGHYTYRLAHTLRTRGHRVVVATGSEGQTPDALDIEQATPVAVPVQPVSGDWGWRSLPSLGRAILRWGPDVVHIQYQTGAYHMHPAITFAPWFIRRFFPLSRVVVTMHDLRVPYLFPKAAPVRRWVMRRLLGDARARIVTNTADQQALQGVGIADPDRFTARTPIPAMLIPIGSNIDVAPPVFYHRDQWRERAGASAGTVLVAFFGLVSSTKGLLPLVKALALLPQHVRLVIIGGEAPQPQDRAYLKQVEAAIQRLALADRITWTGHCDSGSVSAFLLAADLAALPFGDGASYRRGSLLAALEHGVPTITTMPPQPLVPPLQSGEHALLVPPDAPRQLADAVMQLAADPALRRRLGTAGRELAQAFGWSAIAAAHEDVYNALVP
jgi:polysaccharide biosynthesis protein PslF